MDDRTEIDEGSRWKDMAASELAWKLSGLQSEVDAGRALEEHELRRIDEGSFELCRRFCNSASNVDVADVDIATSWQRLALQSTDDHSTLRCSRLYALAASLALRSGSSDDLSDLDEATSWLRYAIELSKNDIVQQAAYLTRIGLLLWTRFDRSYESRDIEDAVASWVRATQLVGDWVPAQITHEAVLFFSRFEPVRQSGLLGQFAAAVQRATNEAGFAGEKVQGLPGLRFLLGPVPSVPERIFLDTTFFVMMLQSYLYPLSHRPSSIDDPDGAIAAASCFVALMDEGQSPQILALLDLSMAYRMRHSYKKSLNDLCAAVIHLDRVLEADVTVFINYSADLGRRVVGFASIIILDGLEYLPVGDVLTQCRQLVTKLHRAFDLLPTEDVPADMRDIPQQIDVLSYVYTYCHNRFHDADALNAAIDAHRDFVHLRATSSDSLYRLGHLFANLALLLTERYDLSRLYPDLDEAIEHQNRAISLTPPDLTGTLSEAYSNLSALHHRRFRALGEQQDADKGDQAERQAAALAPTARPLEDTELSEEHFALFWAQAHDLDDVSRHAQLERFVAYTRLAKHFAARYARTRQPADRDSALAASRDAIRTAVSDDSRAGQCRSYANLLRRLNSSQADNDNDTSDLRPEIILELLALKDDEFRYATSTNQKWEALVSRAMLYSNWNDSVERFGEPAVSGYKRFDANKEMIAAFQRVLDIFPSLVSQGFTISRRYTEMVRLGELVRIVVFSAAVRGYPATALTWFEQGRAFVWGQIRNLGARVNYERPQDTIMPATENDDTELRRQELARALDRATIALRTAFTNGDTLKALSVEREREDILNQLRCLKGLEGFLRPKGIDELVSACGGSAVVCLNAVADRDFHALIPRAATHGDEQEVMFVPFTREHPSGNVWRRRLNLSLGLQPVRASRPAVLGGDPHDARSVLREIWYCIVKPVLDALRIRTDEFPPEGVDLPRITWCTTGALAFLPLHAAGPYDSQSPNAFDLVVSSYTPDLASILPNSRSEPPAARPNIFVVAQPDITGFTALPGTIEEAMAVEELFPGACVRLDRADGTVERVFTELRTHNYVHFACHGEQNPDDPVQSSFVLHDGRLTLERLMDLAHSSESVGELAFLSACETATGDEKVPDEAVHLAAGMLAVGYRSVVATMWSIGDNHAPRVAEVFYETLLKQHSKAGKVDVARALHTAVATLRNEVGEAQIAKWAPFVHYGV